MNINRYNYEEFFILYMDNELLPEDRRAVEAFVELHPDLKEELELLQQFKLSPDTDTVYAGKDELMKVDGETPLTESNVLEWMLLAVDGELNDTQSAKLQTYLQGNAALQKEFALLQMARIPAEQIVFANKSVLYRHEEKVRVIPWRRIAAAIILLVAGLGTYTYVSRKKTTETLPVASVNSDKPQDKTNKGENNTTGTKNLAGANPVQNNAGINNDLTNIVDPKTNQLPVVAANKNNPTPQIKNAVAVQPVKNKTPEQAVYKTETPVPDKEMAVVRDNNLPKPEFNQSVIRTMNNQQLNGSNNTVASLQNDKLNPEAALTVTKTNPAALYTGNNENSNTVADTEPEGGKGGKFRGFIRKVGRTFEKRTNISSASENRLLIAGLSFKRN